jgi:hypothetical protein
MKNTSEAHHITISRFDQPEVSVDFYDSERESRLIQKLKQSGYTVKVENKQT